MIRNNRVYGVPLTQYKDTKANIEALSGVEEGAIAYATDTDQFGSYSGTAWTWGQGGGSIPATTAANDVQVGDGSGNWIKKTLAEFVTTLQTALDSVYAAISHTHAEADITDGSWQLIEDKYLSGGSAASFDFTSIPSTYKHLKVIFQARSDRAFTTDKAVLKLNNDAGNNYVARVQWEGGSEEQNTAGAPYQFTYIAGDTSPSLWFSNSEITFFDYANSNIYKTFQSRGMEGLTTGAALYIYDGMGIYQSTTAISRITLYPNLGANFKQYSRATLFGMR